MSEVRFPMKTRNFFFVPRSWQEEKHLYHINYSVIQGFPALRKVTTHITRYRIVSGVSDIANQLLTRHSPFTPLIQVDEWTSVFPGKKNYRCQSTESFVLHIDSDVQTFLEEGENQNTKRRTESYVFSGFGDGNSRGWEWKSTAGCFATGRFCSTWKISSVGKGKVLTEDFVH